MRLKPFEAGRYDQENLVLLNPANGKMELVNEAEFQIVNFLKQNEDQNLLALLIPNIGIAKKSHIVACLAVLGKLKRMQVLDHQDITGRQPESDTGTLELRVKREKIQIGGLRALSAMVFNLTGKFLGLAGAPGLMALIGLLGLAGFLLFPLQDVYQGLRNDSLSYPLLLLTFYLTGCLALCARALVQGAYLKALKREPANPGLAFIFPFFSLDADFRSVSILGYRARLYMALLGLATPFAVASLFTLLLLLHLVPSGVGYMGFAACMLVELVLICPFLSFDAAEALQVLFFREELEEHVADRYSRFFRPVGNMSPEMLTLLGVGLAWVIAWLDCLRVFWETIVARIATDLASGGGAAIAAGFSVALFGAFVAGPLLMLIGQVVVAMRHKKKNRLVVEQKEVRDSLSFEERMAALEKIPLFAYLNDQERLALLNEMQPAYFRHGVFLVHQGELGREFFVLVKGQANAYYTDMKGKDYFLADLREGDAFGEIALIDDVPRTASIVSDGGCITLVLRKEGFDRFAASLGSADRVKALVRLTSFFRRHPLFSKLSPRDQAQLIDSFRFETITLGEAVPVDRERFHVVYSGALKVEMGAAESEATLRADDCFGYSNPYGAKFVATEGSGLLTVGITDFHNLIWEKLVQRPELFI
jgi:CRP-like cAMP-binding protein